MLRSAEGASRSTPHAPVRASRRPLSRAPQHDAVEERLRSRAMSDALPVGEPTRFLLDGREVEARPGETIWQAASRLGTDIPHLCHAPQPGYRPDGNCRA